MCNGIQGIVLRRLSCSWSIEPRKKAVYNTDFNFNIHKILPELFLGTIPTGFFDLYCWMRSTLKAVHSGVILRVLLYWRMTLKNHEITTSPVSNGRIVLFWTNIWVICHFSLSAYRKCLNSVAFHISITNNVLGFLANPEECYLRDIYIYISVALHVILNLYWKGPFIYNNKRRFMTPKHTRCI